MEKQLKQMKSNLSKMSLMKKILLLILVSYGESTPKGKGMSNNMHTHLASHVHGNAQTHGNARLHSHSHSHPYSGYHTHSVGEYEYLDCLNDNDDDRRRFRRDDDDNEHDDDDDDNCSQIASAYNLNLSILINGFTLSPSTSPTTNPSRSPTTNPSRSPSTSPTNSPTASPTTNPTSEPSVSLSRSPTTSPTITVIGNSEEVLESMENNDSSSSSPLITNLVIVTGVLAAVTLLLGAGFYRQKHKKDNRDSVIVEDAPMISNFFTNLVYSTPNNNESTIENENYYLQPQTKNTEYSQAHTENAATYSEIHDSSAIYNTASPQNETNSDLYDLADSNESEQYLYDLANNNEVFYNSALTSSK
jgi:hypothetical protein